MAELLMFNPLRALDANGYPIPGAKAYFYGSGTTTEREVYADSTGSTPLLQPIEANGNGVFPPVFAIGGGAVRVNVTTPTGGTVDGFPMDPVFSAPSEQGAADGVQFSPTAEIPETDVQAAIERVQANSVAPLAAFGLGVTGAGPLLANLDATGTASGTYRYDDTTTGTFPAGVSAAAGGVVMIERRAATAGTMLLIPADVVTKVYTRQLATTWRGWNTLLGSGDGLSAADWRAGTSTTLAPISPELLKLGSGALGMGQDYSAPIRAHTTAYQNTTDRPLFVSVTATNPTDGVAQFQVAAAAGGPWTTLASFGPHRSTVSLVIPRGRYYKVTNSATVIAQWVELVE